MRKKKKYLSHIFIVIILLCTMSKVKAVTNPYHQTGPYGTNCTWYAWNMAYQKAGVALPGWGNAKDWYYDAMNAGYSVGTTPRANSIVVWGGWTTYGHVGYVESVGDNTLYVWDSTGPCIDETDPSYQECMANSWCEDTDRVCKENAKKGACAYTLSPDQYGITGYIYLDTVPTSPQVSTYENTYVEPSPTVTEEVIEKSSNTNLSQITITNGTISFQPDVLEYEIQVEHEVETITVNATVEDEKATVEGTGEYKLKVGVNEIKLVVTAEDGTTKEYQLHITREKKEIIKKEEVKETTNSNQIIYLILGISGSIFVLILGIIFFIRKRKKKLNQNVVKSKSEKQIDRS